MKEIVTVEQAERVIIFAAIVLPAVGIVIGAVVGWARKRLISGVGLGLIFGLVGPLILALWRMYNAIMEHYGLDSVRGLLINLALFVCFGAVVGLVIGVIRRREAFNRR